ncbi:YncE family protein [Paracoccus sp. Z330]|uniref:YncE family protein n=1 Tax=Paracoccus onchidii TaxID=3017813 RepID=A0ABT4ZFV3_9RHOB|nr:YncE family protein [Paracoccus onchidii]MDB6178182.1 YncE family protein [Paracoccus onchidii]
MRLWLWAWLVIASPAQAGDLAFITSQNGNQVSIIDLQTRTIIAKTILADAPAPVAYDPASARAYVIAADSGRLSVIDETGTLIDHRDLGSGAFGIAAIPDAGLLVTDWYGDRVMRLDMNLAEIWVARTGRIPSGVAISEDGALVATADRDDNAISLFAAETGRFIRKISTFGEHPFAVTFHDGKLFSADVLGDAVSVMDPGSGALLGHVDTGKRPYGIAFSSGLGFVTNQYSGTVTVFDPETLTAVASIDVGDYPEGIAPMPDGSGVVLANWDSDTVMVIDGDDLAVAAEIEVPAGPRAFGRFTGRQVLP